MRLKSAIAGMRVAGVLVCSALLGCGPSQPGSLPPAARAEIEKSCRDDLKSWPVPVDPRARSRSQQEREAHYAKCVARRAQGYGKK